MGSENRVSSVPVLFQCWIVQYMEVSLLVHEKWRRHSDHMINYYQLVKLILIMRKCTVHKMSKFYIIIIKPFCVLFFYFVFFPGAFLIPFFVSLMFCGVPLYFLEVSLGQFSGKSPVIVWSIYPLSKGISISVLYQSISLTHGLFYFNEIDICTL